MVRELKKISFKLKLFAEIERRFFRRSTDLGTFSWYKTVTQRREEKYVHEVLLSLNIDPFSNRLFLLHDPFLSFHVTEQVDTEKIKKWKNYCNVTLKNANFVRVVYRFVLPKRTVTSSTLRRHGL
jgi:hypothetical protein